jgi:uncharacterized OB-fold protein
VHVGDWQQCGDPYIAGRGVRAEMELARHWRLRNARYRLEGSQHRQDGHIVFPPREGNAWQAYQLSGKGKVLTYTEIHQAPLGHEGEVPYLVAMIELAEGPRVTAQLTDCDATEVQIGMAVEMVTRLLGDTGADGLLVYGYKFRPVL